MGESAGKEAREEAGDEGAFAGLLREIRARRGLSQSALARAAGIDPSYLNRIERAEREPPKRSVVEALARELDLSPDEADRLLVAAGHLPRALARLGPLDPTIRLVAGILADETIPLAERRELREIVGLIARRWPVHADSVQAVPE